MPAGVLPLKVSEYFSMTRVINLPERKDRRRAVVKELETIDMHKGKDNVEFFDAIRPTEAAGFPNPGVRGCFLSHMEVLKEAHARGVESVLVIEDDLSIAPEFPTVFPELAGILDEEPWGLVYFGYTNRDVSCVAGDKKLLRSEESVGCTHFYAVHQRVLPQLLSFLELVISASSVPRAAIFRSAGMNGCLFSVRPQKHFSRSVPGFVPK
jgi:glycosyl transferase family 25